MEFPDERPPPNMRGMKVRYRPNHRSFGAFMKSDQMREPTVAAAEDVKVIASRLAPRRKDRGNVPNGTSMADRFEVNEQAGFLKVSGNIRVKVEVYNEARSAAPNEFGGPKNKRYRMLGRAGAEVGEFKPDGGPG